MIVPLLSGLDSGPVSSHSVLLQIPSNGPFGLLHLGNDLLTAFRLPGASSKQLPLRPISRASRASLMRY